jgi:membrane-bound lytic murein transglycosylase A
MARLWLITTCATHLLLVACEKSSSTYEDRVRRTEAGHNALPAGSAPAPCSPVPVASLDERMHLAPADFSLLPGWKTDKISEAIPAFLQSCSRLDALADDKLIGADGYSGQAKDWRAACQAAKALATKGPVMERTSEGWGAGPNMDAKARSMFEAEFKVYEASSTQSGATGKLTGYCVQHLNASRKQGGKYQTPMYKRPSDLISIDLSTFIADSRGRTVWGRVNPSTKSMEHYSTRAEIRNGVLDKQQLELLWVDDKVDAMFAEIEGSAVASFADGSTMWLEVDGKTSRPYRGVGKILRDMGAPPGTGSMQGIRKWFAANPKRFDEIANQNESFVFFKSANKIGAQGSQGVTLVPQRSAAVDRAFVALSTPMWIDTNAPGKDGGADRAWQKLVIAQDTGGGIKGPVRADIYWGATWDDIDIAGRMNHAGKYYLLLPRALVIPPAFVASSASQTP